MINKVLPLSDFNDQARLNAGLQLMEVQPEGHPSSVMVIRPLQTQNMMVLSFKQLL